MTCCNTTYAYKELRHRQIYCDYCMRWECIGCTGRIIDDTSTARQFDWSSLRQGVTPDEDIFAYLCSNEALVVRGTDIVDSVDGWETDRELDGEKLTKEQRERYFVRRQALLNRSWQSGGSATLISQARRLKKRLGNQFKLPKDWIE